MAIWLLQLSIELDHPSIQAIVHPSIRPCITDSILQWSCRLRTISIDKLVSRSFFFAKEGRHIVPSPKQCLWKPPVSYLTTQAASHVVLVTSNISNEWWTNAIWNGWMLLVRAADINGGRIFCKLWTTWNPMLWPWS